MKLKSKKNNSFLKNKQAIKIFSLLFLFYFCFLFPKGISAQTTQTSLTLTLYQITGSTTVTYNSTGATACGLTTPSNPPNGWFDLHPTQKTTYTFTCWNTATGQSITKSIVVSIPGQIGTVSDILTGRAEPVRATKAKLWGSLNPGGAGGPASAKAYFRYSSVSPQQVSPIFCNDIYGSNMRGSKEVMVWGNTPQEVNIEIQNLIPNTTYYYCIVGSSDKEIVYGGVKSFTTWPESNVSIKTNKALVVNETSAFLNGFYNTNVKVETWFEYRQYDQNKKSFGEWKGPIGKETHEQGTNGNISYELKNLSSGETYQFIAVARDIGYNKTTKGNLEIFNTKGESGSNSGTTPGGIGYVDPCSNTDDVNCSGTGGGSNIIFGGDNGLPDLTATSVSPTNTTAKTPTNFFANIKNIGRSSTEKSFYSFFQISTIYRESVKPGTPQIYEIKNNTPAPTLNTLSKLLNKLKIKKANAVSSPTGTMSVDNTIFNLPAILIPELYGGFSHQIENTYTFQSNGTYYMRACADKKSITDNGLIQEAYENNNCGPWTKIIVGDQDSWSNDWNNNWENNTNDQNYQNLTLGQKATPPIDATVRYHEGIEHVFVRQIKNNTELAKSYGYREGVDLNAFAWDLADLFARTFGYVNSSGKEIRVSKPDIAAYQLYMNNGILTVYEYYDEVIVNIQKMTEVLRSKYDYEYYFKK